MIRPLSTIDATIWGGDVDEHFAWDGEITPLSSVGAFAVRIEDGLVHFVITQVLADPNNDYPMDSSVYPYRFTTAGYNNPWSKRFPINPRALEHMANTAYSKDVPNQLDSVELGQNSTDSIKPGDMIRVQELLAQGIARGRRVGQTVYEVSKIDGDSYSVEEFFLKSARLKPKIAAQLLRAYQKRERLLLLEQARISPNQPVRPFAELNDCSILRTETTDNARRIMAKYVFGGGPVKDHFVDIIAEVAPESLVRFGGLRTYTESGVHHLTPNITPFGHGSIGDPLCVISIEVYTESTLNPAVGEQNIRLDIDGVAYAAIKDSFFSSRYFDNVGHRIVVRGFRETTTTLDTYRLKPDGFTIIEPEQPPVTTLYCGAPLLVPRSMLDHIEILFPSSLGDC